MIERIPDQIHVQTGEWRGTTFDIIPKETFGMACRKINEIIDAVNELQEEAKNNARIRANHENLIDTLIVENNIHEKQIDELQMKAEPQDIYAEQRKWIGKLCKVYDDNDFIHYAVLEKIFDNSNYCYGTQIGDYRHCEPVKPDDDIIYKGARNE